MKFLRVLALLVGTLTGLFGSIANSRAQIFQDEVIGYYNLALSAGDNLIGYQFYRPGGNSLNNLFASGAPEGATFTKWDDQANAYLPLSTYSATTGWSVNYEWNPGEGGRLSTPTDFTATCLGYLWPGFNCTNPFVPPANTSEGTFLLACLVPICGASFQDVIGRNPYAGEAVEILDAAQQSTTVTTYSGNGWSQGAPLLAVGQAAFFHLQNGPIVSFIAVPEPAPLALLALGLFTLLCRWRSR